MKLLPENAKVFGKFDEYDADIIEALGLAYDITANSNGGRFDIEPKLEGTKYFDLELVYRLHHGLSINSEVNHEELREYQKDVERLGTTTVEIGDKSHNLTTTLAWVGWFKYKKNRKHKKVFS